MSFAQLEDLHAPALDRAMVEQLFGLSRRSALRLVDPLCKAEQGKAMLVRRTRLLAMLDDFARHTARLGRAQAASCIHARPSLPITTSMMDWGCSKAFLYCGAST